MGSGDSPHRHSPLWKMAIDLAEEATRLASTLPDAAVRVMSARLTEAAFVVPAAVAQSLSASPQAAAGHRQRADAALLELEALVLVAKRFRYVNDAGASGTLHLVTRMRESLAKAESVPERPVPSSGGV